MYPDNIAQSKQNDEEEEKKNEILEDKQRKKDNLNLEMQSILSDQVDCTKKMYDTRLSEVQSKQ